MKKIGLVVLLVSAMLVSLTACSASDTQISTDQLEAVLASAQSVTENVASDSANSDAGSYAFTGESTIDADDDDLNDRIGDSASVLLLEGDSIQFTGSGATVSGSTVTITSAGEYIVRGTLNDGQILVDTDDEDVVHIVLDGVEMASSTSAPIYVANADKVVITLAEGSVNVVTDAATYMYPDAETDEPNAAIFSNDDLTINGSGSLTVNANYNNGIASDDDLLIVNGNITVNAVNDGIKGKDSLAVLDGAITVIAGADGMQASNDEDPEQGYIVIEGGVIAVYAGLDGIQAETALNIYGGELNITSGGGNAGVTQVDNQGRPGMDASMSAVDADSTKGLKAGVELNILGGSIVVDSLDDAVHSNSNMTISGGTLSLATSDDGIHADTSLTIEGGAIVISTSYEGIESAAITVLDGDITIVSSDDAFNASTGGGMEGGRMGGGGNCTLVVEGGSIVMYTGGDGLDSNGSMTMSGGVVIIHGPVGSGNGSLDYGSFQMTGGTLIAAGSAGMAMSQGSSSTVYGLAILFQSTMQAGTLVHIETADGEDVLTFAPAMAYQYVLVASPDIESGGTYVISYGGSSTGTESDGVYVGGTYSGGTQYATATASGVVTVVGSAAGIGTAPGGQGGGRRH